MNLQAKENDHCASVEQLVNSYAKTWQLLWQYDEDSLPLPEIQQRKSVLFSIDEARKAIDILREKLFTRGEATDIFGHERGDALAGIIGAVQQTFGGKELYPGIEEKATHLLYFIVKDHPFTDGNKRIGSFLFLLFLGKNGLLDEGKLNNNALVALTLLVAASDPGQKDLLIHLIANLLVDVKNNE